MGRFHRSDFPLVSTDINVDVSPLCPSVPLTGSDRVRGLYQCERDLRRTGDGLAEVEPVTAWRSEDSIFDLTLPEVRKRLGRSCNWTEFFHDTIDKQWGQVYSIPGSLPCLWQRIDCNFSDYPVMLLS
jgi:hypothetical protein